TAEPQYSAGITTDETEGAGPGRGDARTDLTGLIPGVLTAAAFVLLFAGPISSLARDWWTMPEAGHGLLLAPVAIWFAWRSGIRSGATANPALGLALLVFAVLVRYAAGLAAELFTMR